MQERITVIITGQQILDAGTAIQNLNNTKLPVKSAYWVSRALDKITPHITRMQAMHKDLVFSLGEEEVLTLPDGQIANTGQMRVTGENMAEFNARVREYTEAVFEIEIMPIELSMLGDAEMTPADMTTLKWLLCE